MCFEGARYFEEFHCSKFLTIAHFKNINVPWVVCSIAEAEPRFPACSCGLQGRAPPSTHPGALDQGCTLDPHRTTQASPFLIGSPDLDLNDNATCSTELGEDEMKSHLRVTLSLDTQQKTNKWEEFLL